MRISRPAAFGIGALTALVLGSGTAYAATGGKFILGHTNSATSTTTLKNTRGTALSLSSRPGTPSLKVSNSTKVPNLNADRLDGYDSSAFSLASGQTNTISRTGVGIDVTDDGIDDAVVAVATCPAGTRLTGGGGDDYTSDGVLFMNSPIDRSTWMVGSTTADVSSSNWSNLVAYAQCYNPRGGVAGGSYRVQPRTAAPSDDTMALVKQRLARKLG